MMKFVLVAAAAAWLALVAKNLTPETDGTRLARAPASSSVVTR